jgi:Transglutaminase-like superfamily
VIADVAAAQSGSWWREARKLDALQWRYLALSLALLPLIDVSLRTRGYQRTVTSLSLLSARGSVKISRYEPPDMALRIARMVSLAGRRSPWPTTCLRQALALWFLLARRGVATEVRIGAEKPANGLFAAHAWVEQGGHVLIGGEHVQQRYVVLK